MSDLYELPDLAAARLGGRALWANDEFFAEKENLLKEAAPIYVPDRYTDRGKWMDGWESRRRRQPGHDRCVIRLGLAGIVRAVVVDTSYFKGNFPESCSLEGCAGEPSADQMAADGPPWIEILPKSALLGDHANRFALDNQLAFTHLRLNIFPDGGVARLRVHGEPLPDWPRVPAFLDLASLANGGFVVDASDRFFGPPHKLGLPGPALGMHDGWETKRRRGPGHDWVIVRLGAEGEVQRLEVDTAHFKGNAPGSCALDGCLVERNTDPLGASWTSVLPRSDLQPHQNHVFEAGALRNTGPFSHVRLNIYPDGGIARLRVCGTATAAGREAATLRWLNAQPAAAAAAALLPCCASTAWAAAVAAQRPFADRAALLTAAARAEQDLERSDWLEAFAAHPRLGERGPAAPENGAAGTSGPNSWAAAEQAGVAGADDTLTWNLAEANRRYESRFGHVFLLCATGKTGLEMLEACTGRLRNQPDTELRVAAAEQGKITKLRLEKFLWGK